MTLPHAERVTPPRGAILHDVELSEVMSTGDDARIDAVVDAVYGALIEHQVVFFENEPLAPADHAEFGRRLGTPAHRHHSYHTLPDEPDVVVLDWQPEPGPMRPSGRAT